MRGRERTSSSIVGPRRRQCLGQNNPKPAKPRGFFCLFVCFLFLFFLPQQHAKKINPEALPPVLHGVWSNFLTNFSKSNTHNTGVTRRSLGKTLPALKELPPGQTGYAASWHPSVLTVGLVGCDTWISLKKGLNHESLTLASLARQGEKDLGGSSI